MPGRNMLDQEFEEEFDILTGNVDDKDGDLPDPKDVPEDTDTLDVEIVDDTPDEDKGKWTADKKPTDVEDEEDEQAQYSRRVKERIAKETAKVHAERRAKEDRERQLAEAAAFAKRMIEENNRLKGLIENGEKVLVTESNGRLEGQINAAKSALREAREAGDIAGEIAAQENLSKLVAERERLSTYRPQALPRTSEEELKKFEVQQVPQRPQPGQRELSWQDKNPWFGKDEVMTATAMAIHGHLVNREGILPAHGDAYWSRIDTEMRKRFPERFQREAAPRRTDTVVAAVSRNNAGKATRKVTLTESQVRLAKRLGLTPAQYAEQLVAESGKKEWTHGQ